MESDLKIFLKFTFLSFSGRESKVSPFLILKEKILDSSLCSE